MKWLALSLLLTILNVSVCLSQEAAEKARINQELDAALAGWSKAFNARDAAAVAKFYTENADVISPENVHLQGRKALQKHQEKQSKSEPDMRTRISDVVRNILSPTTVIETGIWELEGVRDASRARRGRYTCTLIKQNGKWLAVHERGWPMPLAEGRSYLRTRDPLSRKAAKFFTAISRNDTKFLNDFLADNVVVKINNVVINGKRAYLARLNRLTKILFKDIAFEDMHIHTNYFSPKALASNGQTVGDRSQGPMVWTNAWMDFRKVGRTTGQEHVNRNHLDFRWKDGKVAEILIYGDPTFGEQEEAALASARDETTVTRKDFQEFCDLHDGWWSGQVASVIGEADVAGKRKDTSQYYWGKSSISTHGNTMTTRSVGPKGTSELWSYFDPAAKKIRVSEVTSAGIVNHHTFHRDGKTWVRQTRQTAPDGTVQVFDSLVKWSDDGSKVSVAISRKNADGSVTKQTNVWHRVRK